MRSHHRPSPRPGFTLVELMVTLAVLTVVLTVAVPSMAEFTANNQLATAKSAFASAVALARTEAAKRGRTVIVQSAAGGAAGNEYAGGWGLYVDDDGDGVVGAGDTRLRLFEAPPAAVRLSGVGAFSFRATGYLNGNGSQGFTICRAGSGAGYQVTVLPSGVADVAAITTCE